MPCHVLLTRVSKIAQIADDVELGFADPCSIQALSASGLEAGMLDMLTIASFVKVIEKGSFSAAAYELSMTPSSISKQISRLERMPGRNSSTALRTSFA